MNLQELQYQYKNQKDKISQLKATYTILISNPLEVTLKQIFDSLNSHHEILLTLEKLLDKIFNNNNNTNSVSSPLHIKKISTGLSNTLAKSRSDSTNLELSMFPLSDSTTFQRVYKKPNETQPYRSVKSTNRYRGKTVSKTASSKSPSSLSFIISSQDNSMKANNNNNFSEEETEIILMPGNKKRKFQISPSTLGIHLLQTSYNVLGKYNAQTNKNKTVK